MLILRAAARTAEAVLLLAAGAWPARANDLHVTLDCPRSIEAGARPRVVLDHYAKRAPPSLRPLLIAILSGMTPGRL